MVFVRTLGAASVDAGPKRLAPSSVRRFALFFYLWAERGRAVTRSTLHELVFPDQTAKNARHSIRELLYQYRKLGVRIAGDEETAELVPETVRADYSDLLRQERPSLEQMRAAAGGFMPGYAPTLSETYTEWLEGLRTRSTNELNRVFVAELNRARRLGDWMLAEAAAKAVLTLDPLHEEATLATAEMLAISGAKTQAVKLLDRYVEEVGSASSDLKIPATVLRRRISERSREIYRAPLTLPFLGRDAEMAALQERLARARAGEAQCVVIVGEAGIGKTRLAEELCTQAVLAGAQVERVAMQPHDVHRPMATFADIVPTLLQLRGALGCSPESIAALRRLTKPEPGDEQPVTDQAGSETIAAGITRALADLLDAITGEAPLVIFVDDAQWTDDRSRETLTMLAAARRSRRLFILLTSRDRAVLQFLVRRSERVLGLSLSPLTTVSSRELTNRVLQDNSLADRELLDWLSSTAGGNPFFLRSLIEHYQSTGDRFVVPSSLSVFLDQKVAALSDKAVALLGTCVALGRHSDLARVVSALEIPSIDLQVALAELEAVHLIVHAAERIEPAHSLVAETVQRLASPLALRLIHRRVANLLQSEAQNSESPALLWDCAEHWIAAGEPSRAADFLERCAGRALEIGRPREAAELLLRAAGFVKGERAIILARGAATVADGAHEVLLVKRAVGRLRELGVQIEGDPLELAELNACVAQWDDPKFAIRRLQAWVVSTAPLEYRVRAAVDLLIVAETDCRPEFRELIYEGLIRELPSPSLRFDSQTLMMLLIYHCGFSDEREARSIVNLLLEIVPALPGPSAANILRKCGVALWRLGIIEDARRVFERWFDQARADGMLRAQFDAALTIAGTSDLDTEICERWQAIADSIAIDDPKLKETPAYVFFRLDTACNLGNPAEARTWLRSAIRLEEESKLSRLQRWVRAGELRIRQLEGSLPTVVEASGLIEHHRPQWEVGDLADFELGVFLWVLSEHGEFEAAQRAMDRYFRESRRTRNPASRIIHEAADALRAKQIARADEKQQHWPFEIPTAFRHRHSTARQGD
jgi:DNA-binding SARP family transcriptional activator